VNDLALGSSSLAFESKASSGVASVLPVHEGATSGKAVQGGSTVAIYAHPISKALSASGVDSARVLKAANLAIPPTSDPLRRVPVAALNALFAAAVAETGDEYFGLKVAGFIQITHLHALGHALAVSGTLMEFCERLKRYMRLASHACEVDLVQSSTELRLILVLQGVVRAEREDAFVAFLVQSMRRLYKPEFNPVRVDFHRAMPSGGSKPYEEIFKSPVEFGQPNPALTFLRSDMHQPLLGASAELAEVHDQIAMRDLARLERDDVVAAARQKIVDRLPAGDCTRESIAAAMCMSAATLRVRLAKQGTNFNELLDTTRRELAAVYVRQLGLPLYGITFLLGFSDSSHFSRAFKRWEGISPRAMRQRLRS
jgi:AraC-like DNA-binding protein